MSEHDDEPGEGEARDAADAADVAVGDAGADQVASAGQDAGGTAPVAWVPGKNGGRLLPGGKPGNKGGGSPSKRLRSRMRQMLEDNIEQAEKYLTDPNVTDKNKQWALDYLAKYSLGAATVQLDDEGDAVKPSVTIVEVEEG